MKNVIAIFCAAAVAGGAAWSFAHTRALRRAAADLEARQAAWAQEKSDLEKALAAARQARPATVASAPIVAPEPEAGPDAEAIIEQLRKIRASSREGKSIRRVIHHLEQLVDLGPDALPAIEAYLGRFEDIDYSSTRSEDGGRGGNRVEPAGQNRPGGGDGGNRNDGDRPRRFNAWRDGKPEVRLTFTTPPSLRIGLIDALQSIGGESAERILADLLGSTGRPLEVAYTAKVLDEMAPGKHRATAIAAARDLLTNPLAASGPDALDDRGKDYLYYVLAGSGDAAFASTAQSLLVASDGRIDQHALNFVASTLKEQALPALVAAYRDPRLTNQWEKAALVQTALDYAGPNAQANELLNAVVSDEQIPSRVRASAVMSLARGEPEPELAKSRLPVVEALRGSTTDERVLRSLDFTERNLQNIAAGQPVEEFRGGPDRGAGGGGPPQRRNRGN